MAPPVNDNFANRISIGGVAGATDFIDLTDATREQFEREITTGYWTRQTAWYEYTCPQSGTVVFDVEAADLPSGRQAVLDGFVADTVMPQSNRYMGWRALDNGWNDRSRILTDITSGEKFWLRFGVLHEVDTFNTSPTYCGTGANHDDGGTTAWSNPTNIEGDTTSTAATVNIGGTNGSTSQKLRASNFGFSIPNDAVIFGVRVEIERSAANATRHAENNVQLLKGGTEVGTNKSQGSAIPTTKAFKTFGNTGDLWGTTLTPADVNDSGFGVSFKIVRTSTQTTTTSVFRIRITVTYGDSNSVDASAQVGMRWAYIDAPPHDDFANALELENEVWVGPFDVTAATTEPAEQDIPAISQQMGQSTWYKFVAPVTDTVTIDVSRSVMSDWDGFGNWVLAVWTGTVLGSLTHVASWDINMPGPYTKTFSATQGTTYWIQLGTWWGEWDPHASIMVSVPTADASNDDFADAYELTAPSGQHNHHSAYLTLETGEPNPTSATVTKTAWYHWNGAEQKIITIQVSVNDPTQHHPVITVWSGTTLTGLTQVKTVAGSGSNVSISFTASANVDYYIQVGNVSTDSVFLRRFVSWTITDDTEIAIIGTPDENESTNSNTVTITLTEDVPAGTEEYAHGLAIVLVTQETFETEDDWENWDPPFDPMAYPTITDSRSSLNHWAGWLVKPVFGSIGFTPSIWKEQSAPMIHDVGGFSKHLSLMTFRGVYYYLVNSDLFAGDTITITTPLGGGPVPSRIAARAHRIDGVWVKSNDPNTAITHSGFIRTAYMSFQHTNVNPFDPMVPGYPSDTAFIEGYSNNYWGPSFNGNLQTKRHLIFSGGFRTRSSTALKFVLPGHFSGEAPYKWTWNNVPGNTFTPVTFSYRFYDMGSETSLERVYWNQYYRSWFYMNSPGVSIPPPVLAEGDLDLSIIRYRANEIEEGV